jgi:hypothetical protein
MLTDDFSQGHIGFFANRGELRVTSPVAQEIRAVFPSQSADESVSTLFLDAPVSIAMAAI